MNYVLNFGAHKGQNILDVPLSYINWCIKNIERYPFNDKELMKEVIIKKISTFIEENGILIGSRAWGGSRDNSDYDYCVTKYTSFRIQKMLENSNIKFRKITGYGTSSKLKNEYSYYIDFPDKTYNIIVYESLDRIILVNKAFEKLKQKDKDYNKNILNKEYRVKYCERFIRTWGDTVRY